MAIQSVYIETTIPSYLTSWPAKNLVAAAHQALTREWWELRRTDFQLFTSQLVLEEASGGDSEASRLRLDVLKGINILPLTEVVEAIANDLFQLQLVPPKAGADAFHIAYAAAHKTDYLLTWNCRHIANAERLPPIEKYLLDHGCHVPIVCTPEELMGDSNDGE